MGSLNTASPRRRLLLRQQIMPLGKTPVLPIMLMMGLDACHVADKTEDRCDDDPNNDGQNDGRDDGHNNGRQSDPAEKRGGHDNASQDVVKEMDHACQTGWPQITGSIGQAAYQQDAGFPQTPDGVRPYGDIFDAVQPSSRIAIPVPPVQQAPPPPPTVQQAPAPIQSDPDPADPDPADPDPPQPDPPQPDPPQPDPADPDPADPEPASYFFGVAVEAGGRQNQIPKHTADGQFIVPDPTDVDQAEKPAFVFEASYRLDKHGGVLGKTVPIIWQPNQSDAEYEISGYYGDLKINPDGNWVYELRDDDPRVDNLNDGDVVVEVFLIRLRDAVDVDGWPGSRELHILIYGVTDETATAANKDDDPAPHGNSAPPSNRSDFDIVQPGNHSAHNRPVIIDGSRQFDSPTIVSPFGSIVSLKRGGNQIAAEQITLNDGGDHVIYLLTTGANFGTWRPDGGYQLIRDFDLGVDKLWFIATEAVGGPFASVAFEHHWLDGQIVFDTFDSDADNDPLTTDHDAVRAVSISAAPHPLLNFVLHKLTIEIGPLDDQRAAFQIISNQPVTGTQPFDAVAEIFEDSLGYIDGWHDIDIEVALPDAALLPSII
ncbi:VCBS domain-containing protein [Alphaproteobacteria bacterium]|nr:VCBS domain-containing protein [Alphaproteobacteria bacterium]